MLEFVTSKTTVLMMFTEIDRQNSINNKVGEDTKDAILAITETISELFP